MHIELAHRYWKQLLRKGDIVIDATCGNGKDTLFLAETVLTENSGSVIGLDIQEEALSKTRSFLKDHLSSSILKRIALYRQSHETFPDFPQKCQTRLIVYNLGYLPGGDKSITTKSQTTVKSLKKALKFLKAGSMISITCYPGHEEGKVEEEAVMSMVTTLNPSIYSTCIHMDRDRPNSPSLILVNY